MTQDALPRRLAAIVSIDLVGYSALAERDEAAAAARVAELRRSLDAIASAHSGRLFSAAGDGFMLEFPTADSALAAAFEMLGFGVETAPVRIGAHLGDVTAAEGGDLLGHAVNVAARLREEAEENCLLASKAVYDVARGTHQMRLTPSGRVPIDKTADTVEAFAFDPKGRNPLRPGRRLRLRFAAAVLASGVAVLALGAAIWSAIVVAESRRVMMQEIVASLKEQLNSGAESQELIDGAATTVAALSLSSIPEERRAFAHLRGGETDAAVAALEAFSAELEQGGDRHSAAAALARAGMLAQISDRARALTNLRRAHALAPGSVERFGDLLQAVAAMEGYPQAFALATDAMRDRASSPEIVVYANLYSSILAGDMGDTARQRRFIEAAAAVGARASDPYLEALFFIARGYLALGELDLRTARSFYEEGRARLARLPGHERDHQQGWLLVLSARGDFEGVWRDGRAFAAERRAAGAPAWPQMMITMCVAGLQVARVLAAEPFCVEGARGVSGSVGEPSGAVALAMLAAEKGDLVAAEAHAGEARRSRWFAVLPANHFYAAWADAQIAARRGDIEALNAGVDRALSQIRTTPGLSERHAMYEALLERRRADGLALAGAMPQACAALARSMAAYESIGGEEGAASAARLRERLPCTG